MVHNPSSRLEYAAKFFIAHDAFERERDLYHGENPLGKFLPQVISLQPAFLHKCMLSAMNERSHSVLHRFLCGILPSSLFCRVSTTC
jgi:hypothetical protein